MVNLGSHDIQFWPAFLAWIVITLWQLSPGRSHPPVWYLAWRDKVLGSRSWLDVYHGILPYEPLAALVHASAVTIYWLLGPHESQPDMYHTTIAVYVGEMFVGKFWFIVFLDHAHLAQATLLAFLGSGAAIAAFVLMLVQNDTYAYVAAGLYGVHACMTFVILYISTEWQPHVAAIHKFITIWEQAQRNEVARDVAATIKQQQKRTSGNNRHLSGPNMLMRQELEGFPWQEDES